MLEHIANIQKSFDKHDVSNFYDLKHNRDSTGTTFVVLEKYVPHCRGSNGKLNISRAETNWIYKLCSHVPRGLNVGLNINCFINNS